MTRALQAEMATGISDKTVYPVLLFEGEFVTGFVRFWSGVGELDFNGNTYLGTGDLGTVGPVEETSEIKATGVTFTLSGIPSEIISLALQETRHGQTAKLWFGLLDAAGKLRPSPYLLFEGTLDVPVIVEGAETSSVSITYENDLVDLERARGTRYTSEDQKSIYPTDLGFDFTTGLVDKVFLWG